MHSDSVLLAFPPRLEPRGADALQTGIAALGCEAWPRLAEYSAAVHRLAAAAGSSSRQQQRAKYLLSCVCRRGPSAAPWQRHQGHDRQPCVVRGRSSAYGHAVLVRSALRALASADAGRAAMLTASRIQLHQEQALKNDLRGT